jgi:hypothetical protein
VPKEEETIKERDVSLQVIGGLFVRINALPDSRFRTRSNLIKNTNFTKTGTLK